MPGEGRGDRRLNVAVHEEVLGREVRIGDGTGPNQEFTLPVVARDAESGDRVPAYSGGEEAARRVVDAMRRRGWEMEEPRREGTETTQWAVGFHRGGESVVYAARTESAPESICRAALRAVRSRDAASDHAPGEEPGAGGDDP